MIDPDFPVFETFPEFYEVIAFRTAASGLIEHALVPCKVHKCLAHDFLVLISEPGEVCFADAEMDVVDPGGEFMLQLLDGR